jgi:RNA polymerase sigma-70 factor (ECF subfamily)
MTQGEKIVKLLQERNEKGITLLYDKYSYALLGISKSIVGNPTMAEEILNKSFLKIWDNIEKYDSKKGAFFTWMSRIVKNTSLDYKKSKAYSQGSKTHSITESVVSKETQNIKTSKIDTDRLLEGLDEKYKIVLEYLYLKGYTQKEASDELNIPIGTIKTRLKKAIDILRKNIDPEKTLTAGIISLLIIIVISNLVR